MNIGIAIAIYLVLFAGIIALQIFYFKTDRKLLLAAAAGLGGISATIALMLSTYYGTALERIKGEALFIYGTSMEQIPDYQNYIIICIFAGILFFLSILFSLSLIIIKKILIDKELIN